MGIIGIDHVVLRVNDLDEAISSFKALGMELTRTGENPAVGKQAFFRLADGFFFELVEPLTPESPVGQALAKRGEGVHSIAMAVDDHDATRDAMSEADVPLIPGGDLPVSFVHPKAAHGVMLQIMEPNPAAFDD
ncbi:MAG: VOC family protein [Acidimicrobiia bacterium]|nr:VOC family protein [Acidimicrobiia bacterium]